MSSRKLLEKRELLEGLEQRYSLELVVVLKKLSPPTSPLQHRFGSLMSSKLPRSPTGLGTVGRTATAAAVSGGGGGAESEISSSESSKVLRLMRNMTPFPLAVMPVDVDGRSRKSFRRSASNFANFVLRSVSEDDGDDVLDLSVKLKFR